MKPEIFAEWLRRQGHTVFQTDSSYWFDMGPRVFQAFPYHWLIHPDEGELSELLKRQRGFGLRFSTSLSSMYGKISYHVVYDDADYDFESLGRLTRRNVRRGLRNCLVEPISFRQLADKGWELYIDTLDRQGRKTSVAHRWWQTLCLSAADLDGFQAWGAMVAGKLAASVITFEMDGWAYILYQQCLRQYLAGKVNNVLAYSVTKAMLERPSVHSLLYGLHSLDAPPSVDEFKFHMGYRARPVRQRVVFHHALRPFFNRGSHAALRLACRLRPGNAFLAKAEGLLRFYIEGQQPLARQSWPAALADQRHTLLA